MKTCLILLFASTLVSQAAVIKFALSPPGTDNAVGLSPANEVPPVASSSGSGGAISGGITYDTDTHILTFALGYGSAAGFNNLTGPATAAHIHGPANVGVATNVALDLAPFLFPALNPAQGGLIFGTASATPQAAADLRAGLYYLNIHTAQNPNGEIRGQLIALTNDAPTLVCPNPVVVECGTPTTLQAKVGDVNGDALTVTWKINTVAVQTNQFRAKPNPPNGTVIMNKATMNGVFPFGTNVVEIIVTDSTGSETSCTTEVVVLDRIAPVINSATATPNRLSPADHSMQDIKLNVVTKNQCGPVTWKILSVTSNEATSGLGNGDLSPDWEIVDDHNLRLRAERSESGFGRVYTISVQAEDAAANKSGISRIMVSVPRNQNQGH